MNVLFPGVILISHCVCALIGTSVLRDSILLEKKQKKINLLCLWLMPFVWFAIILMMHKKQKGTHEIEKEDIAEKNNFYESGSGIC